MAVLRYLVHEWDIEVVSDCERFLEVLEENLLLPPAKKRIAVGHKSRFTIEFLNKKKRAVNDLDPEEWSSGRIHKHGLRRMLNHEKRMAAIVHEHARALPYNWLYHACFLQPLSSILRNDYSTLAHAALLSDRSRGMLLIGEKGAGKSTVTLKLMSKGLRYYSDEHPILSLRRGKVVGMSFPNRIALDSRSVAQFPSLHGTVSWKLARRKYFVNPTEVASSGIGEHCEIQKVVFLKFLEGRPLDVVRLKPHETFAGLVGDEYFQGIYGNTAERSLCTRHLDIFSQLSSQAVGYAVKYGTRDFDTLSALIKELPSGSRAKR